MGRRDKYSSETLSHYGDFLLARSGLFERLASRHRGPMPIPSPGSWVQDSADSADSAPLLVLELESEIQPV